MLLVLQLLLQQAQQLCLQSDVAGGLVAQHCTSQHVRCWATSLQLQVLPGVLCRMNSCLLLFAGFLASVCAWRQLGGAQD